MKTTLPTRNRARRGRLDRTLSATGRGRGCRTAFATARDLDHETAANPTGHTSRPIAWAFEGSRAHSYIHRSRYQAD